jgi:Ca2+-binding RTX toxin-like protein
VLNRIEGTAGRDRPAGTSGDDLIIANGGNRDTLTGGAGDGPFVFGPGSATASATSP